MTRLGHNIGLLFAYLALSTALATSVQAGFMYSTSTDNFFTPPTVYDPNPNHSPAPASVQVAIDGHGSGTFIQPTDLNMIKLGTVYASTSSGSSNAVTSYNSPDPNIPTRTNPYPTPAPTMGGPIMVNISTTIRTSSGLFQTLTIRGILTGTAAAPDDDINNLINSGNNLAFDGAQDSVVIGDDTYTLALLRFPDFSQFHVVPDGNNFNAFADIFARITVTPGATPPINSVATPEPGTMLGLLIGAGMTGTSVWTRRRKPIARSMD